MSPKLVPFLRWLAAEPFSYGRLDCLLAPAEWAEVVTGHAPAAAFRGAYHDEASCAAVLAAHGHAPRLVARVAREVGAVRVTEPTPGDIAVLRVPGRWYGAIRTPAGRWAVKCGPGLHVTREGRPVGIWRL